MRIMLLLPALALLCMPSDASAPQPQRVSAGVASQEARSMLPSQSQLLDLALAAASKLPAQPHIKSRSQLQEVVVNTCLLLDQPERALAAAGRIANWRRGSALADWAGYRVRHGATEKELQQTLSTVSQIAEEAAEEGSGQRWRSDRIHAKLAQVYVWLGRDEEVARHISGIEDAEVGRVTATQADQLPIGDLPTELARLSSVIDGGVFDQVRGTMATGLRLFDRFYDDEQARRDIKITLDRGAASVSRQVWIDVLHELASMANAHGDKAQARKLLDEASALADEVEWLPEHRVAMLGRMAELRHLAGDTERAQLLTSAALSLFAEERGKIVDIYRSETLLPVAEALIVMGQQAAAMTVYRNALLEGTRNPNGRPQVEDLIAICCSMARVGFEPDPALMQQIASAVGALSAPW